MAYTWMRMYWSTNTLTYVRTNVNECWVFLKQGRKAVILWNSHHFFKQPKFFILKWFLRKRQERGKGGKSVTNIYENNLNVRLRIGARFRKKSQLTIWTQKNRNFSFPCTNVLFFNWKREEGRERVENMKSHTVFTYRGSLDHFTLGLFHVGVCSLFVHVKSL